MLDALTLIGSGGANRAMEAELKRLSPRALDRFADKPARLSPQVLRYPYSDDLAWLAVRYLRTPSRALRDFAESEAEFLEPLYQDILAQLLDNPAFAALGGRRFTVEAKDRESFPASPLQVRGTVKNAILAASERLGAPMRLDPDTPELHFRVWSLSPEDPRYIVSLDLAGRSLHQRGYRVERVEAPLRETVAAQMLMLARWDSRQELLFDPMCGSGTLPIEAALMAHGAPLWLKDHTPDAARLPGLAERGAGKRLYEGAAPVVVGCDIDREAVQLAQRNVQRAGVGKDVLLLQDDFQALDPRSLGQRLKRNAPAGWRFPLPLDRGLVIANPPYGERLSEDPRPLYERLGRLVRSLGRGWRAAFIVAHEDFEVAFGAPARVKKPLNNGPLRGYFLLYDGRDL